MDRGIKQILWMSWTLRSRILCSSYAVSNRVNHNVSQNYWTNNGDIFSSEKLEQVKRIMQESETYSSKDCIRILNVINDKHLNMDVKETMDVLTALVKITKECKPEVAFMSHKGFKILCEQLKKQIRLMSLSEVINCIKYLTFLNVPASTVIMQNLLQIIRNSINDLQIDQVHLLLCLLKRMERSSLSSALLIALPMLLPTIINAKLNHDDLHELSVALFRIKHEEQPNLIHKICKSIQVIIKQNPKTATMNNLKNVFCTLCYMPHNKFHSDELVDTMELVKETLFHKAHYLGVAAIAECIHSISHSVLKGNMSSYNTAFINTLLEVGMSKSIDCHLGYTILKDLNSMLYIYVPFLEYLLNKNLSQNISNYQLSILLNAFCISDYKPIPWDFIESKILKPTFLNNNAIKDLLQCAMCLAALDKYYPKILSEVFIKFHGKTLLSLEDNVTQCARLLCLYQGVKAFYEEYEGPWPSEKLLNCIYKMLYFPKKNVLWNKLKAMMGGPQYVLCNLQTKIGHIVDYAIIMRKGGYPIAYNTDDSELLANYNNYVEELQCPPESYVILILEFSFTAYSINTLRLIKTRKLQLRSLEKWTGHKCIDINVNIWENLPNHEKSSYLMQKIRNECDDIVSNM